ncbi:MAG: hypothetical protein WAP03_25460 [Methylorubrum rhodinum]|uniref:hypothetical protein n=1 Tax=Methylorubrum rhodinum TaxID=29428 RepID=UPI003BB1DA1D
MSRGKTAAPHVDVADAILGQRRLPCICPRQHKCSEAVTVGYSTHRGIVTERVACEGCGRRWNRINCR